MKNKRVLSLTAVFTLMLTLCLAGCGGTTEKAADPLSRVATSNTVLQVPTGEETTDSIYTYNENGDAATIEINSSMGQTQKWKYEYAKDGTVAGVTYSLGEKSTIYEAKLTTKGDKTKIQYVNKETDETDYSVTYTVKDNYIAELILTQNDGTVTTYIFDDNGYPQTSTIENKSDDGGFIYETANVYEGDRATPEKSTITNRTTVDGQTTEATSTSTATYNDKGLVSELVMEAGQGMSTNTTYTYTEIAKPSETAVLFANLKITITGWTF